MPLASDRDEEINMLARLWNAPRQQNDATELSNLNFAANWERVLQALAMQPVQTFSEETDAILNQPHHWASGLSDRIQQTEHQLEEQTGPESPLSLPRIARHSIEWRERLQQAEHQSHPREWREGEIPELMAMTQNLEKEIKKQAEKESKLEIKRKNRYQILKENSADEHKSPI